MSGMNFISSLLNGQSFQPSGSKLVIADWKAEGTPEGSEPMPIAPLHRHLVDDEAWYVLEGRLAFQIDDEIIEASSGQAVIVPSGKAHTYWNPAPEEARYLLIMTATISTLIEEVHRTTDRSWDKMKALFSEYESELL
ncbi:cupin domain-containing protein [Paenibacillus sp. OV219]|uniref:cupin domain-containing protein n=1 Tax=Paenibacillus sp. OV219 TaxID=1884377 RepID=UPI0008CA7826|nr:cupin domain-containing protein [Paenibacillus sp. OV219]SEM51040.1 Cupin domain-containing protein [Paenibacillus sp. OV219]